MVGKIPEQFIQDVLARTDIVDLIDARVPLKRSGSNFMACCPFHHEKTPSFSVNRQKQFYYCFGCGAHGTAISFLMDYDRLTFPEAIEELAGHLGLPVPRESGAGEPRPPGAAAIEPLYDILERASRHYQQQLKTHPDAARAVAYLRRRGVSGEIARRYRLGFAPPGPRGLPPEWPPELLQRAGLTRDRGGDWFRDRVMFPIRDRRGRTVGFGGRILDEGQPKYLNSPETDVFHKHREVYGLYELLESRRKPDGILVVEGYMDVIALAQFGLQEAVATLGTATSAEQVGLLFRYSPTLVFCFDGDAAGRKAAWKALESSLAHLREGRQLRFLLLPEGYDPDSLVREEGVDGFRHRIEAAQTFSDYFFDRLLSGLDIATIEGRAALVARAQPHIQKLPGGVFRDMVEQHLAALSHQSPAQAAPATPPGARDPRLRRDRTQIAGHPSAIRTFLALLVQHPRLVEHIDTASAARLAALDRHGALLSRLIAYLAEHPDVSPAGLLEGFRDMPEHRVLAKLMAWDTQVGADGIEPTFLDHLRHLTVELPRASRLEWLIQKSRREPLSDAERAELRALTSASPGP